MSPRRNRIVKKVYPVADNFVRFVAKIFAWLRISSIILSIVYTFWIVWVFSRNLREVMNSTLLSIVVYIALMVIVFFIAGKLAQRWNTFVLGRPVFGELGGIPYRTMAATIRSRSEIEIELPQDEQPYVRDYNIIQFRILHDTLKEAYMNNHRFEGTDEETLEAEWKDIWEKEILEIKFNGLSFKEAADVNKLGFNYTMVTLVRATMMAPFLVNVFWMFIVFLIYKQANESIEALTALQIGLALSFLIAAFWSTFVIHNLSAMPLTFAGHHIPDDVIKEYGERIQELERTEVQPTKVTVKPKFYGILRGFQSKLIFGQVLSDTLILGFLIALIYGITYLINSEYAIENSAYLKEIILSILLAGVGLTCTFYIFSLILEKRKKFAAALITAVLSAGLPFAIDYLLGGTLNISGMKEAIFAGSAGLSVAFVTAITSYVKESLE